MDWLAGVAGRYDAAARAKAVRRSADYVYLSNSPMLDEIELRGEAEDHEDNPDDSAGMDQL